MVLKPSLVLYHYPAPNSLFYLGAFSIVILSEVPTLLWVHLSACVIVVERITGCRHERKHDGDAGVAVKLGNM
jgi:hypothetical protein